MLPPLLQVSSQEIWIETMAELVLTSVPKTWINTVLANKFFFWYLLYDILFYQAMYPAVSENLTSLLSILEYLINGKRFRNCSKKQALLRAGIFLFYRQKVETYQTGELTSLNLSGRQWHIWDSSFICCHTTFNIFIQSSIKRADEIITCVTKSPLWQNCSLENSMKAQ